MTDPVKMPGLSASRVLLRRRIEISSFRIEAGECVVLCGPNGSGKSSLLRLMAGLETEYDGEICLEGKELRSLPRREIAQHLAWLPQRPSMSESLSCWSIVAAARFRFLESPSIARAHALRILEEQDIGHLAERPSDRVSGGELQRVLIAALVAQETPFLLVDEPANHLDPRHQVRTYRQLGKLWREAGKAVLLVSHDVRLAQLLGPPEQVRILGIKEGQITEETHLGAENLAHTLERLYETSFVKSQAPGGLAIDLSPFSSFVLPPGASK